MRVTRPELATPIIGRKYINANGVWTDLHYLKDWPEMQSNEEHMTNRLRAMGFPNCRAFTMDGDRIVGQTGTGWLVSQDGLVMAQHFEGKVGEFDAY